MSELTRRVEDLRDSVRTDWAADRSERVIAAVGVRRRRRTVAAVGVGFLVVGMVSISALNLWQRVPARPPDQERLLADSRPVATSFTLADGSRIEAREAGSLLSRKVVTAKHVVIELAGGSAHFDVTPNHDRVFEVEAGQVTVAVLGTAFDVQRLASGARVSVDRGRVRVSWPGGGRELAAGQDGMFPSASESSDEVLLPPSHLKAEGAPKQAFDPAGSDETPSAAPTTVPPADEVADLMRSSDALRQKGAYAEAVAPLSEVVERHSKDPRAPSAAFTIGRLYLERLGAPVGAAKAFAKSRELDSKGPLAEDALAREVESLSNAGDQTGATERAREYLRSYPQGSRRDSVKSWGGIE
jgi:transmembrane sensor